MTTRRHQILQLFTSKLTGGVHAHNKIELVLHTLEYEINPSTIMDDLNPLAGTAHLLEEVDSNYCANSISSASTRTMFIYLISFRWIIAQRNWWYCCEMVEPWSVTCEALINLPIWCCTKPSNGYMLATNTVTFRVAYSLFVAKMLCYSVKLWANRIWRTKFCILLSFNTIFLTNYFAGSWKREESAVTRNIRRRYIGFATTWTRTTPRKTSTNFESSKRTRSKCERRISPWRVLN